MTLRTPVCELLGIEYPVVQAGMGPFTAAELVAAVSNAGGLGSLGAATRPVDELERELARTRELTNRPFAVNHVVSTLNEEAFALTLEAKPAVISFAVSDPGELVERAHAAGSLVMHQVTTMRGAYQAAARSVDLIVAQGTEAGGLGGALRGWP